jgi:hypothetical protein
MPSPWCRPPDPRGLTLVAGAGQLHGDPAALDAAHDLQAQAAARGRGRGDRVQAAEGAQRLVAGGHQDVPLGQARARGGPSVVGGAHERAGLFTAFAIRDHNLITGQQQYSGTRVAEVVVSALGV